MAIDWKSFYANGGWQGLEPPSFYEQDSEEIECEECEGEEWEFIGDNPMFIMNHEMPQ